jgi:chromosome partitioning protein
MEVFDMPTIVVASPKGGAGKSTTSVLLGTELANAGANVTMFDCDPNGSLTLWAGEIIKRIREYDVDGSIVIVDLEGVASRLVSRAISQADLVVTPMRATTLDATIGVRALSLIAEEEEALGRSIRHAVVFTMTRAIRSKQHTGIEHSLRSQGVDIITPSLLERAAFAGYFEFGGDLSSMPPQGNMEGAVENAKHFAQAVYGRLIMKD